ARRERARSGGHDQRQERRRANSVWTGLHEVDFRDELLGNAQFLVAGRPKYAADLSGKQHPLARSSRSFLSSALPPRTRYKRLQQTLRDHSSNAEDGMGERRPSRVGLLKLR